MYGLKRARFYAACIGVSKNGIVRLRSRGKLAIEPDFGKVPFSFERRQRDSQQFRRLHFRQSGKKSQLNHLTGARIESIKLLQSFIQRQQIEVRRQSQVVGLRQRHLPKIASAFLCCPTGACWWLVAETAVVFWLVPNCTILAWASTKFGVRCSAALVLLCRWPTHW